ISFKLRYRQNLCPLNLIARQSIDIWIAVERARFQRTLLRIIASEETRIADDALNNSGQAETNDAPVETWCATTARLPAVHPFSSVRVLAFDKDGRTRLQQVLFRREEVVVRIKNCAAQTLARQINQLRKVRHASPRLNSISPDGFSGNSPQS